VGYRVRSLPGTGFELNRAVVMWLDFAEEEYAHFAAQRRALLEEEGAVFNIRTLEEAAKMLPKPKEKDK